MIARPGMEFVAEVPAGSEVVLLWLAQDGPRYLVAHPEHPPYILLPDGRREPVLGVAP